MKKLIIGLVLGMLIGSATTALASTSEVTAVFAQFALKINGQDKHLDTTPLVYNGTSYLPVRDMANLFGYDVTYKADSRTIELNTPPTKGVVKPMAAIATDHTPLIPVEQDGSIAYDWTPVRDLLIKFGGQGGPGRNITINGSTIKMPDSDGVYVAEIGGKDMHIKKEQNEYFIVMAEWN